MTTAPNAMPPARLLAPDMWSGWGIRTLSSAHPAYNPFSYQLGSVWPHDSVIAAAGFRSYGLDDAATQVIKGVFDAATRFRSMRLPELYAGLQRDPPLGIRADAPAGLLTVDAALPDWLPEVEVHNVRTAGASADVVIRRGADSKHELDARCGEGLQVSQASSSQLSQRR